MILSNRFARRAVLAAGFLALLGVGPALRLGWAGDAGVTIDNFSFNPAALTVPVGTTVTWTNRDDIPHTIVDARDKKAFKSKPMDTDDKFSFTFAMAGTYKYFCSLHPHMQGTITVK